MVSGKFEETFTRFCNPDFGIDLPNTPEDWNDKECAT